MQPNQSVSFYISYYLDLVLKHRWLLIAPFCLAMIIGMYLAVTLPPIYEANTMILVEPQRVPQNYVKSVVTQDIESRISSISQQILSRTNLEKVIEKFHMFSRPEHEKLFLEDKLKSLRERIEIKVSKARAGNDTFSISFRGSEPDTTMKVTNALAAYFIDENLKARESQSIGTNVFLEGELISTRERLQVIEETLKDYRERNMGELPEQLQTNLAILSRSQEQLTEKQKSLRETKAMLVSIEQQIAEMPDIQVNDSLWTTEGNFELESGNSVQIEQLNEELANLRLKYTDRHPDVIRLTNTIAQLELQNEKESENDSLEPASKPSESEMAAELPEIGFQDLQKIQKDEIRRDIRQQQAEIAELNKQIDLYRQRVENTPKREQELFSLKRDYENIKDSYDSLVQRKLEAEIAVNMEKKQKGEQFRIIDHAVTPQKPISPDMRILYLLSIAAGLGIGGGLIFLIDYFDTSVTRSEDIEQNLGISVLATIPKIYQTRDLRRKKMRQVMTAFSLLVTACLLGSFAALVFIGPETALEVVKDIISSQTS